MLEELLTEKSKGRLVGRFPQMHPVQALDDDKVRAALSFSIQQPDKIRRIGALGTSLQTTRTQPFELAMCTPHYPYGILDGTV